MAIPNLRNMINGYARTPITPIEEPPIFHYDRGSGRPPPPTVPSDHPSTILLTPAADSSLRPPQSHRQPRPPPTKAVLKATWLNCEDCVQKTKKMIKEIAPVQGIQHLKIDPKKGVIEVEGSIDAHWLRSFLARQFKRNVEVLTEDDQNKGKDKEGSSSVGDREDTEETDKTPAYTSIEREQVHHPIKEQNNLVRINGYQQIFSDNVKADSDLQQPPTLPDVNLPNSINKNPNAEAKNSSSPQSPPTQPPNLDSYMVSPMREVVLKTQLHCEGCIRKLKTILLDVKGVQQVKFNIEEELMEVHGTMDTKQLPIYLTEKLKRKVEIIQLRSCMSPENSKKDNTEKKQDAQSNQHMISKTDDISARELNSQIDYISRIKGRTQDQCPKRNQLFNSPQDYIGSDDPVLENKGNRKGREAGEKGEQKRAGEKKQNIEGPKGGVMLGKAANKEYVMGWPAIYTHPHGYVLEYGLFSDENPNACSVM